ncbi:MAG: hypothetical protein K0S85_4909, partial [Pseudomonas orientalis]|nr:hypothetical protein [Pseudomonas orientalis]
MIPAIMNCTAFQEAFALDVGERLQAIRKL